MRLQERIRVLVIDDSAYSRRTIAHMLEASPLVEVVGGACDGGEALRKTLDLEPDLITLDLEMPGMDGFTFLRLLMSRRPTPVLVVSGRSGDQDVFKALELGAMDFVAKPSLRPTQELQLIQHELIRKVHSIRQLRIDKLRERLEAAPSPVRCGVPGRAPARVVAIGASTGGPAALMQLFGAFTDLPPCAFLISQHMPAGFTRGFAERLDRLTHLSAREARGGETLEPGSVLVAPGGRHLELESVGGRVVTRLAERRDADKYAPAVDRMFASAAKHHGSDVLGVVLTGMGDDGREGVRRIKEAGGTVIAESEQTAVIFGMPQQAIRTGLVDAVLPLQRIAAAIQAGLDGSLEAGPHDGGLS